MTTINDIVLIYFEDHPLAFARIEEIEPDHKRGWYHVKLLMLQIPLQVITWILREEYINGDTFTMNNKQIRMERVIYPRQEEETDAKPEAEEPASGYANVISLADLKKK